MRTPEKGTPPELARRDMLKLSGLTLGGLAMGKVPNNPRNNISCPTPAAKKKYDPTQQYSYFDSLKEFPLGEPLATDEMRITFLGTSCIPRVSQECNSIFVEVGAGSNGTAPDQFVFDCGSGVATKYNAMGIQLARMNKIFLTHLHGDHMSDLAHIYCFGPAVDRKAPLYIWGPSASGVENPKYAANPDTQPQFYNDGTKTFCENFRKAMRWHSESFSFEYTAYADCPVPTKESWGLPCDPVPVDDDDQTDGYAVVPIELDWTLPVGVAYSNPTTGVTITHFQAIHCRKGSISYKLEWNGLSMIFSGDTKPNYSMVEQAKGVDVLIHEMVVPADVWAKKNLGIPVNTVITEDDPIYSTYQAALANATAVQNSSHTPQGAFGYMLSQINPRPRLTVATHFQAADDTVASALKSVLAHFRKNALKWPKDITWATDLMVINVSKKKITQRKAVISEFAFYPYPEMYSNLITPKYWTWKVDEYGNLVLDANGNPIPVMNPYAQIDTANAIPQTDPDTGEENYREDGY